MDSRKYLFAFLITAAIFATSLLVSSYFSEKKLSAIQNIEDQIALDILASETQSALLAETSCNQVNKSVPLSKELGELSERLSAAEKQSGLSNPDVIKLKRQYFLLEIRDYLLMKSITEKCNIHPTFILYFYSNDEEKCPDCQKTGFVLTALHEELPDIRIYSFDADMDLEALQTLRAIYGLKPDLPALVINGDPYYGFQPLDELVSSVPALKKLRAEAIQKAATQKSATSTATSTDR